MTRERIKDFKEIVLPFFTNYLLKKNYENLGKSDAEEFEKDFSEIIELADKALEQQPCEDTISRQAAIDALEESKRIYVDRRVIIGKMQDIVSNLPSAQPERKKGKWIPQDHNKTNGIASTLVYYYPKCSVCGHCDNYTNFCSNCGADMRGEQDE